MKINLLPAEYRPEPIVNIYRIGFISLVAFCSIVTSLLFVTVWLDQNNTAVALEQTKRDLDNYGQYYEKVQFIEEVQKSIQLKRKEITGILEPYMKAETLLGEVINALPDRTWLTDLSIAEDGNVVIRGKTDRMKAVSLFMVNLELSSVFQKTTLESLDKEESGDSSFSLFKFSLKLEQEKAGATDGKQKNS